MKNESEQNRRQRAQVQAVTRRHFFQQSVSGLGAVALTSLLNDQLLADPQQALQQAAESPLRTRPTHFPPRAKNVIFFHMSGSPPQQELLDHKPKLNELDGQPCPDDLFEVDRFAFIKGVPELLGTPYKFAKHGESGHEISELLPHLAGVADELCIVRGMHTDQFNHAPAQMFLYTGSPLFGRPSMGSWITYGIGSENADLPGFVVFVSGDKVPSAGDRAWGSGFLPSVYQGVQCRSAGEPVLYVNSPEGLTQPVRRRSLDAIRDLNRMQLADIGDPEIATRIAQYELAYRMQTSVPEVMDISQETQATLKMYGAEPGSGSFSNNCLLARRLVERGVHFVQLFDWGWDNHGTGTDNDLMHQLPKKCSETDRPIAALIRDLRDRGLLDETLVIWGGEFGRTPMNEKRDGSVFLGRDHHPHCFTIWMAGGGVKPGFSYGISDELGYHVVDEGVHVHDLQATILHLLGLHHEQLTFKYQGRPFRLTDVFGNVVHELIA